MRSTPCECMMLLQWHLGVGYMGTFYSLYNNFVYIKPMKQKMNFIVTT